MGYDCTLHVVDPQAIHDAFCAKVLQNDIKDNDFGDKVNSNEIWKKLRAALRDDAASAASTIAAGAILFSAATLPAHDERGFCLALWESDMEDDSMIATVQKKHRGSVSDLDELFAPIIAAHPQLKGKWPTELTGNGSVGIYIPKEKIAGLLKWVKGKVKTYPKPYRRVFRGLLLVLEECERRGLAYWEATDIATVHHPIRLPEELRPKWIDDVPMPRGSWDLTSIVSVAGNGPECVFHLNYIPGVRGTHFGTTHADFSTWPPGFEVFPEVLKPCDRSRAGRWIGVASHDENVRTLELRDASATGAAIPDAERARGAWHYTTSQFVARGAEKFANIDLDFVAFVDDLPVIALSDGFHRPHVYRDGKFIEAQELPPPTSVYEDHEVVRFADGRDVLIWGTRGYELVDGVFRPTLELVPGGWFSSSKCCAVLEDAIILRAGEGTTDKPPKRLATLIARRGVAPREIAAAAGLLDRFMPGPPRGVVARQIGSNRKHIGCILWPEEGPGGTLIWIDDDLFPDEDPDHIRHLLWSRGANRLIAVTSERLWAVDGEKVLALPRYDATTGKKLKRS